LAALREAVLNQKSFGIALTALDGMAGIGKTVLAQVLCGDRMIQERFRDGIAWVTIGRESAEAVGTRLRRVASTLGEDLGEAQGEEACINLYRSMIGKKAALVVLDDVWKASDVEPFRADAPRSCVVFTTRDQTIASALGAEDVQAGLLSPEQSLAVLSRWTRLEANALPGVAAGQGVRAPSLGAGDGRRLPSR